MNNRKLNIDIQKLFYRVTPLLCCLVLLVAMFPVSASAVTDGFLDYNDYITSLYVDGDNDIVTFNLPMNYWRVTVVDSSGKTVGFSSANRLDVFLSADESYRATFYVLNSDSLLSIENIPSDSTFKFAWTVDSYNNVGYLTPYVNLGLGYYNASRQWIYQQTVAYGNEVMSGDFSVEFSLDVRSGFDVVAVDPFINYNSFAPLKDDYFSFNLNSVSVTVSISSLYRLQEETGKTNELLQLVLEKLNQIEEESLTWYERIWKAITDGFNAVLDAIGNIIGISEEDKQAAEDFKNDAIDKSEKLEGAVDAMGSVNKPPADQVQAGMDSMLPSDGGNYVSQTMNVIVGIPLVTEQLSIVVIIMFASFVLFGKKEA